MRKKLFSNESLIGIAAMIISLSTLVVFIYQTNLIRKQQYRSVYPHLNLIHMRSSSIDYKYVLRNQGIGPAFITSIDIQYADGDTYHNFYDYVRSKLTETDSIGLTTFDINVGSLVQEKEEIPLLTLSKFQPNSLGKRTVKGAKRLREILANDSLKYTITYESIYGESWRVSDKSQIPIKE